MKETVRNVAQRIAGIHMLSQKDKETMISSIPARTLDTELSDGNLYELEAAIDKIRFGKEGELAKLLQLNIKRKNHRVRDKDIFYAIVNFPASDSLDFRKKEIHFLFSVAATIIHF